MDQQSNQQYQQPPQTNGKAIASMVIGILSIVIPYIGFILGIIGIVLANKAFKEIAREQHGGRGMAVAGLTTSIIGTAIYAIIILIVIITMIALSATGY